MQTVGRLSVTPRYGPPALQALASTRSSRLAAPSSSHEMEPPETPGRFTPTHPYGPGHSHLQDQSRRACGLSAPAVDRGESGVLRPAPGANDSPTRWLTIGRIRSVRSGSRSFGDSQNGTVTPVRAAICSDARRRKWSMGTAAGSISEGTQPTSFTSASKVALSIIPFR